MAATGHMVGQLAAAADIAISTMKDDAGKLTARSSPALQACGVKSGPYGFVIFPKSSVLSNVYVALCSCSPPAFTNACNACRVLLQEEHATGRTVSWGVRQHGIRHTVTACQLRV